MRCEDVLVLIDAYVDGELSGLNRRRVNRHIRLCTVCAAELQAARRQSEEARIWRDESAPESLRTRIAAELTAAGAFAAAEPDRQVSDPAPPERVSQDRRAQQHKQRVGMATLLAPVCALLLWMVVQRPKPLSYAQVEQAMGTVHTFHWTMEMTMTTPMGVPNSVGAMPPAMPYSIPSIDCWARIDPPAIVGKDPMGNYRPLNQGIGSGLEIQGPQGSSRSTPEQTAFSLIFPPALRRDLGLNQKDEYTKAGKQWLGVPVMSGRRSCVRFTSKMQTPAAGGEQAPSGMPTPISERTMVVLVDAFTHRIVSIEDRETIQFAGVPGPDMTLRLKDFEYDAPVPSGIFQH
jgi:hypothetical protein